MAGRDPTGPPPDTRYPSLRGRVSQQFARAVPAAWGPGWDILLASDGCFTTSSLPTAIPQLPPFSFGRKPPLRPRTEEPCLVRDSWGHGHCAVPYQPQGESVWLEDWNLNAVVSDFVTFLLGSVNPPFPLLSMCASSPLSWALPFHTPAWAVLLFKCEEIPLCARTCKV